MKSENKLKDLIIIGAGDFGREVAWVVERINQKEEDWHLCGFVDDDPEVQGQKKDGYPVLGTTDYLASLEKTTYVVCSIGSGKTRKAVMDKVEKYENIRLATLIDPDAIIGRDVVIEEGCIICSGNILAINSRIHRNAAINLSCTIGHDAIIGECSFINPGSNISGNVELEPCVDIGTGTKIIQGKKIGHGAVVGAGAVVIRDIPADCTAVGSPAKPIKFHRGGNTSSK